MPSSTSDSPIRLVVFDWAGTTVDHGCFAPVVPYLETFRRHGVTLTSAQVRGPMGLAKRDHLQALLDLPETIAQWRAAQGQAPTRADGDRIYEADFIPLQLAAVRDHSRLIPGLLDSVAWLRERGIYVATTTGYFREAAQLCAAAALEQGYRPDANLCGADVPAGRPAPWMMFRHMEAANVYPPTAVIKIGDTVPDIAEGRNAGAWSVGVTDTASDIALTADEWQALPQAEQARRRQGVAGTLLAAGAHEVIGSVADVPGLVERIASRLTRGERP